MPQHHTRTQAARTSLDLLSVLGGMGAAWLVATVWSQAAVWAVAPLLGATTCLLLESLETALGERLLTSRGDPKAGEVSP